jgi:serine/threonine protein kinase
MFSESSGDQPDEIAGRYRITGTLSTNSLSRVYRAEDGEQGGREVALKAYNTMALFRAEERRQAASALRNAVKRWSSVEHPALTRIFDLVEESDRFVVVAEYVPGWSLQQVIGDAQAHVTPDVARNWGAQLAGLLDTLHSQPQPLHVPFLAPEHVMVTPEGRIKLVGYGLSPIFQPTAGDPYGTVRGYGAPELKSSYPTPQSDIFGLGRLLYALLIDHPLEQGLARPLPLREAVPGISSRLVKTIARAARRKQEQRWSSAADLGDALWPEGEPEPLDDWRHRITRKEGPTPPPSEPAREQRGGQAQVSTAGETMESLGFRRDPRFGPDRKRGTRAAGPQPARQAEPAPPREPRGQPIMSVYPHRFDVTDLQGTDVRRLALTLRNTGNAELVGRVVSHVDWLRAPQKTIHLPPEKRARVILSVRTRRVPSGRTLEPQAISVETNAGRQWVALATDVASGPELAVETDTLDFGEVTMGQEKLETLAITNTGRQLLTGHITTTLSWLRVRQESFRTNPGETTEIAVQLLSDRMPEGERQVDDGILIDSDGGQKRIAVHAWYRRPVLELGATHMDFGDVASGEVAERYLYVENAGDAELAGAARSLLPWLQVFPRDIRCAPGEMAQLTVTADTAGLADGPIDVPQALRVQTNAGVETLSMRMNVRAPHLVLDDERLDLGAVPLGGVAETRLRVRNEGSAPLDATVQTAATWLTVHPAQFHCEPGERVDLRIQANTAGFDERQEIALPAALRIVSGSTLIDVPASLEVLQPTLRIEPEQVDFGYVDRSQPTVRELAIHNEGTGDLAWNLQSDAVWVEAAPQSGTCPAGESQTVTLTAYGLALEAGAEAANAILVINSDGGRAKVPLRVGIASPLIATDTSYLSMLSVNREPASAMLRIFNHGLGLLSGTVAVDQTWLAIDRASFECAMGRSVTIQINTDMELFPEDSTEETANLQIESNGGDVDIQVNVIVELVPELELPDAIRLEPVEAEDACQGRLTLRNQGMATARAELSASDERLQLTRDLVDIKPGKTARIVVRWEGALPGTTDIDEPFILIRSGEQEMQVPVHLPTS